MAWLHMISQEKESNNCDLSMQTTTLIRSFIHEGWSPSHPRSHPRKTNMWNTLQHTHVCTPPILTPHLRWTMNKLSKLVSPKYTFLEREEGPRTIWRELETEFPEILNIFWESLWLAGQDQELKRPLAPAESKRLNEGKAWEKQEKVS